MRGPCPNCGTVISIPTESVKIQSAEGTEQGNEKKRRLLLRPIQRFDLEFNPVQAKYYALGVGGVLLLTFALGCIPMYAVLRSIFGTLGLCLIAFPLTLFGYQTLRNREQMFAFTGEELCRRAGIVAAGYVILWLGLEYFLAVTRAGGVVGGLYFAAFAVLAALLAHPLLVMELGSAFLHYCVFGFSVVLLRFLLGFGWFWEPSGLIRYSTAPPPPFLPGM
jgi:hypothetical protein